MRKGTRAAGARIDEGVRVCLTASYAREQALIAGAIGAEYIAPYLGRMTDAGKDGVEECEAMLIYLHGKTWADEEMKSRLTEDVAIAMLHHVPLLQIQRLLVRGHRRQIAGISYRLLNGELQLELSHGVPRLL